MSNGVRERAASPILVLPRDEARLINDTYECDSNTATTEAAQKRYGRHGDIAPKNLLWFCDHEPTGRSLTGILKLADFGQAEINTEKTKTRPRIVPNTLTYCPPECDVEPSIISQTYDIWSLGCVYLEFLCWLLGGKGKVKQFSTTRLTPDASQLGNLPSDIFFEVTREVTPGVKDIRVKLQVAQVGSQAKGIKKRAQL